MPFEDLLGPDVEDVAQDVQLGAVDGQLAEANLGLDPAPLEGGQLVLEEVQPGIGQY